MNEHKTQGNDEENDVLSWLKFRVIKHCLKHAFASLFLLLILLLLMRRFGWWGDCYQRAKDLLFKKAMDLFHPEILLLDGPPLPERIPATSILSVTV